MKKQYVCLVCGYNMIGNAPHSCPFCGCNSSNFITATECSKKYSIVSTYITGSVMQLKSDPKLGLEHAAYAIKTSKGEVWIDCPSCYESLEDFPQAICFTHHHFMGACNIYQENCDCEIYLHKNELSLPLAKQFSPYVTRQVDSDFWAYCNVNAMLLQGHTPGYTAYFCDDVCFACDITLLENNGDDSLNTYSSDYREVVPAVKHLIAECDQRKIKLVCCYNEVFSYKEWKSRVTKLLDV